MNRVDRLVALILFLQSRRVVTAEQLAEHFELSVRTIYRDIAALGEAGVPIVAEAGVGYALLRGYHLPPVHFTAEEANALVTGGMLVERFADPSVKSQMHSALMKVRAVLPRDHQDRLSRLERGLTMLATVEAPAQANLSILQRALAYQRVLRFRYQGAGKETASERTVEPMGLIYYLERWHLIAWCRDRKDYRDFRTDRMTEVAETREAFISRADFQLADFIRTTMPAPALRAKVKFNPQAADRARREWWMGIIDETRVRDGVILTLAAVDWDWLAGWLLSFGLTAEIVNPESLRQLLAEAAEAAAAHHRKKPSPKVS